MGNQLHDEHPEGGQPTPGPEKRMAMASLRTEPIKESRLNYNHSFIEVLKNHHSHGSLAAGHLHWNRGSPSRWESPAGPRQSHVLSEEGGMACPLVTSVPTCPPSPALTLLCYLCGYTAFSIVQLNGAEFANSLHTIPIWLSFLFYLAHREFF